MSSHHEKPAAVTSLIASRVLCFVMDVAIALHFAAGAFWWWLSPKGFALASGQFWTNTVLPLVGIAVAVAGLLTIHYRRFDLAAAVVICFAAAWLSAASAGRMVFPVSLRWFWLPLCAVSLAGWMLSWLLLRQASGACRMSLTAGLLGALVGICVIYWQIPPPPSTIPWSTDITTSIPKTIAPAASSFLNGSGVTLHPGAEEVTFSCRRMTVSCAPLLEFHLISPDRFWSLFAPRRSGTSRTYSGATTAESKTTLWYSDGARIEFASPGDDTFQLAAYSPLAHDAYSHLNSHCRLDVHGHHSLALSFSPSPDSLIDVLPADYPFGRPARFAYLDDTGTFHVCEASSGEKGPFRELARGRLDRGKPLEIGFHDEGIQVVTITLDDWSAQLSTAISPSAGWGVPVNAIEFQRLRDAPTAECSIWITLAATAVGRGFETVGHRAGTYRNRITFRREPPDSE